MIKINDEQITGHGTKSCFVGSSPEDLIFPSSEDRFPSSAEIRDRVFPLKESSAALELFNTLHPGFFEKAWVKAMDPSGEYEQMVLKLDDFSETDYALTCPEHIRFDFFEGNMAELRQTVAEVDDSWVECFHDTARVYCALDGDRVASFCLVDNFGTWCGMKIGGPGCVGTVPAYRRQGIGLKMVQKVTGILKREGCDLSYIHFTGAGRWYEKLGYRTFLRWNAGGVIHSDSGPLE